MPMTHIRPAPPGAIPVATTTKVVDLSGAPQSEIDAIQQQADDWGVSFDDACLRMLVEHSRALQRAQAPGRLSFISRLFSRGSVH